MCTCARALDIHIYRANCVSIEVHTYLANTILSALTRYNALGHVFNIE